MAGKSIRGASRGPRIGVVDAAKDRGSPHAGARRRARCAILRAAGDPLRQSLMRPIVVEVPRVFPEDAPQVPLVQDEDVVEALPPHAAEEALAGRVLSRCPLGRPQHRDAARRRDAGECRHVLAVVVADEEARGRPERRGLDVTMVSRMLGHASVQITIDIYIHRLPKDSSEAVTTRDAVLRGRGEKSSAQ